MPTTEVGVADLSIQGISKEQPLYNKQMTRIRLMLLFHQPYRLCFSFYVYLLFVHILMSANGGKLYVLMQSFVHPASVEINSDGTPALCMVN